MNKNVSRTRRATRTRAKIMQLAVPRLSVHRTTQHIYAQVFAPVTHQVLAAASSLDKELRAEIKHGGNVLAASKVGALIARRAKANGVERVAFDRSGYQYHGCIKALADAAREGGLQF